MPPSRILVVDDDPIVVDVVTIHLESLGYLTFRARDGLEGWNVFNEKGPDIVITDLNMPEFGGEELLRRIKDKTPDTFVIILTGEGSMESVRRATQLGCDDYLQKPILDLHRLSTVVRHSISRRDLLSRAARQDRISEAKRERLDRLCDELRQPVQGLLASTSILLRASQKRAPVEIHSLALEIKGFTDTLVAITESLCEDPANP
jgi:CheY-like chemotaxis protein